MAVRNISFFDGQRTLDYLTIYGNDQFMIEDPGDVHTDLYGLESCTAVFKMPQDRFDLVPPMFAYHPLFTYLNMERRRLAITPGYLIVTGEFVGIPGGQTTPIYEIAVGLADEPIETHPKFVTDIGGTPSSPKNGAVFLDPDGDISTDDAIGRFAYFSHMVGGTLNTFAGIDSYLAADQISFRQKFYATFRPNLTQQVGFINFPQGPAPPVSGPNWLLISCTYEQRGNIFFICNEWRNSGRRGWNTTIYAP